MISRPLTLRPASSADALAVAALWRDSWASANPHIAETEPLEHWLRRVVSEFAPPRSTTVVCNNDQIVGFFVTSPSERQLQQLFVSPSWQGMGVGAWLIDGLKSTFPEGFSLHVAKSNLRAQRFYERNGLRAGHESVNPQSGRARVEYAYPGSRRSISNAA